MIENILWSLWWPSFMAIIYGHCHRLSYEGVLLSLISCGKVYFYHEQQRFYNLVYAFSTATAVRAPVLVCFRVRFAWFFNTIILHNTLAGTSPTEIGIHSTF